MSRYIDVEPIQKFIENGLNNPDKRKAFGFDAVEILAEIEYTPTADVKEITYGEWIDLDLCFKCSYCGHFEHNPQFFCPNCGSDMRGEKK